MKRLSFLTWRKKNRILIYLTWLKIFVDIRRYDGFHRQTTANMKEFVGKTIGGIIYVPNNMAHYFQGLYLTINSVEKPFWKEKLELWHKNEVQNKQFDERIEVKNYRSSRQEVFCEKGVLRNFAKIHRKRPVPESLFSKVAGLRLATSLKKRLWHRCFLVKRPLHRLTGPGSKHSHKKLFLMTMVKVTVWYMISHSSIQ